jgi:exodeoxyribonuclease-1
MKFDEEVTRHMLYRNFWPVYEREYQGGNSRWDIIDLVRAAYALRPEGIEWPMYADGKPCFKLEELCKVNGLEHISAHDALSDVYATIALAKLIKEKQPKLYDYYWGLRDKYKVAQKIDTHTHTPFLLVSGYISSDQGCCTWMMPIGQHSTNKNTIIAVDLGKDITSLTNVSVDKLREVGRVNELYKAQQVPLMQISLNKVPFVASAKTLSPENAKRLGIDRKACLENYEKLKQTPDLIEKCQILTDRDLSLLPTPDVDAQLYTRDFPSSADSQWMKGVKDSAPEALTVYFDKTDNPLLRQQLLRYIGRNYPNLMGENELNKWQAHRRERLILGVDKKYLSLETFAQQIQVLAIEYANDANKLSILNKLETYASEI